MEQYRVIYYVNNKMKTYDMDFISLWAAVYTARRIWESYHIPADVMDMDTGEILAMFNINEIYVSDTVKDDARQMAICALE